MDNSSQLGKASILIGISIQFYFQYKFQQGINTVLDMLLLDKNFQIDKLLLNLQSLSGISILVSKAYKWL